MPFNISDFPEALALPARTTHHSAWHFHIPLTPIFIRLLQPRTFVELGTHAGDSYLAFCQAVRTLGAATRCTAVDTWRGDKHTGPYGPEILAELKAAHDPLYPFSRLLEATFDDAVGEFPGGSIDLLHIDGAHTYEAVRHDFETWLPKLSDRSVVLFHDTAERVLDFGVWKVWQELGPQYPSAHIPHGHGLGILAVGRNVPAPFLEFLTALNASQFLMTLLEALGHRVYTLTQAAIAIHTVHNCQSLANEWRQFTNQLIRNPITPHTAHYASMKFCLATVKDVHQLTLDAMSLASQVATLRQGAPSKEP